MKPIPGIGKRLVLACCLTFYVLALLCLLASQGLRRGPESVGGGRPIHVRRFLPSCARAHRRRTQAPRLPALCHDHDHDHDHGHEDHDDDHVAACVYEPDFRWG